VLDSQQSNRARRVPPIHEEIVVWSGPADIIYQRVLPAQPTITQTLRKA
jgi:hypothetical protein